MANPPNYKPGVGRLATDRYDFQAHLDGRNPAGKTGFRHNASQIDIEALPNLGSATTLDVALENIGDFIGAELSKGEGFVTVGAGYDMWQYANTLTQTYFNNNPDGTPSSNPPKYLDDLLNPILKAIMNNGTGAGLEVSPVPAEFERVKRGGIILIRSGTYIVKEPIFVPPGIFIVGEGFGTKIVNVSSLNLSVLPVIPKVVSTPAPVFKIITDGYRNNIDGNDSAISGNNGTPTAYKLFMFGRKTVISNLVISDNFVEITALGDTSYKLPQNKTGNNPLILQEQGSNFILDNVYLMGRVNFSSGQVVSAATRFAVQLDGYAPNQNGTMLKVNNCFIDGFSVPINWETSGGSNDYLEITNSKIRAFGYLDGNGNGTTNPESNCIVRTGDNNVLISSNTLYGNSDSVTSIAFINSVIGSTPNAQAQSKLVISGNDIIIDKYKNVANTTFSPLKIATSITDYFNKAVTSIFGNTLQESSFSVYQDSVTPQLVVSSTTGTTINSALAVNYQNSSLSIGTQDSVLNSLNSVQLVSNNSISLDTTGNNGTIGLTSGSGNINVNGGIVTVHGSQETQLFSASDIKITGSIVGNTTNNDTLRFGLSTIDVTGNLTNTLTASQYNKQTINIIGTNSDAETVVIFPAISGYTKFIQNNCSKPYNLRVKLSGGDTGFIIPQSTGVWAYSNGTSLSSITQPRLVDKDGYTMLWYRHANTDVFGYGGLLSNYGGGGAQALYLISNSNPAIPSASDAFDTTDVVPSLFGSGIRTSTAVSGTTISSTPFAQSPIIPGGNNISLSFWVYIIDPNASGDNVVWGAFNHSLNRPTISIEIDSSRVINFRYRVLPGSNVFGISAPAGYAVPVREWTLISITYNSSILRAYMNGMQIFTYNSVVGNLDWANTTAWSIGGFDNGNSFTNTRGIVEDVRADSVIRSASYYVDMYRRGLGFKKF